MVFGFTDTVFDSSAYCCSAKGSTATGSVVFGFTDTVFDSSACCCSAKGSTATGSVVFGLTYPGGNSYGFWF